MLRMSLMTSLVKCCLCTFGKFAGLSPEATHGESTKSPSFAGKFAAAALALAFEVGAEDEGAPGVKDRAEVFGEGCEG
eukprot:1796227-Alexandrium_andersonii.AAC.1